MSEDAQKPADRGTNRSRTPQSAEFFEYMSRNWADNAARISHADEVAPYARARRETLANRFANQTLIIAAGDAKQRANDTEYRFRAHSAFSHLTGWGANTVPGSVLVIQVGGHGQITEEALYFRPTAGHDSNEFFANSAIGEFWVGQRPGLQQVSTSLSIETRDVADFVIPTGALWVGADARSFEASDSDELVEAVSELRLVKDAFEIAEMRRAVAASVAGFENIVRNLPEAIGHQRGERLVETAFFAKARELGNELGYDTIAAAGNHANTLHWIVNDGQVRDGDLILVDAGVEVESLYTADITRTLPVNGKFSPVQREIYEAVREAADAVFAIARPGIKFRELHAEAMKVIARKTHEWGILPEGVSAEQSLDVEKQFHRRWMVHGTSHHLGMDVHDCAQAKRDLYLDGELKPGMIFTIEPGLYFHENDLLAPEHFRGIGVRIEDDVLVTENGVENLSAALPRTADDVEAWMAQF